MFDLDETGTLILSISAIGFITIVAGCVSGLTLSLFSIDETYLKVLAEGPDGPDKRRAKNILGVIASPHWLLVTLLLTNAAAIESMPMIIDSLLNPIAAICISVVLVLIFGEVIPQALFIRHALVIGSIFSYPLRGLMWLTSPISWTVAKVLDAVVGHREAVFFRRRELREFLVLQQEFLEQPLLSDNDDDGNHDSDHVARNLEAEMKQKISEQEIAIMLGVLSLSETLVDKVMKTKLEDVVSLSSDTVLDKVQCERLFLCGFSRILVHEPGKPHQLIGFFLTKMLIKLIYRTQCPMVKDLVIIEPHQCEFNEVLSDVYEALQMKSCHLAVVYNGVGESRKVAGIITSHDILEFIHRCSFSDETDMRHGAPMQLLVKSWYQMKFRKQIMQNVSTYGGGPPSNSSNCATTTSLAQTYTAGPASLRHGADIFSSPGLNQHTNSFLEQSPVSHNRSFSRIMMSTRQSGLGLNMTRQSGGRTIPQPLRNRSQTGEREMIMRKPGSPTTKTTGPQSFGYGSMA